MDSFFKFSFKTFTSIALIFSLSLTAQDIEEVIVTATKKAESIQDLAISVEAFNAEDISANMIDELDDLQEVIPGLQAGKGIGSGGAYAIRGTGSYGVGAAVVGAVVTAMNGHSVNTSTFFDIGFYDVSRIEVLKGPQGTLTGRNAVTGVINLVTTRPGDELGGYFDYEIGDYNHHRFTTAYNVPMGDKVKSRFAYTSYKRDGFSTNLRTGDKFDNRDAYGIRASFDFDISDKTSLEFTYDRYRGQDNRNNIGTAFCSRNLFFGCSPIVRGQPNVAVAPMGSTAALSNLLAGLVPTAWFDTGAGAAANTPDVFNEAYMNRIPEFRQVAEHSTLNLIHSLSDTLTMTAKVSYGTRDYYHMNDNDYSFAPQPFPGVLPQLGLGPISWEAEFYGLTEIVDSERTYEFADVDTDDIQAEISIISDLDGPMNFVVGAYQFKQKNHNRYIIQTAALNMMRSFANHPYSQALFGGAFDAYGGLPFYQTLIFGLAGIDACQLAIAGPVANAVPSSANPACLQFALNAQGIQPYHLPPIMGGFFNDDHVRTDSTAIFGELYYQMSDATKLTLGLRYNDDKVTDNLMTCLGQVQCPNAQPGDYESGVYNFRPTTAVIEDDATAFKVAIQHNLGEDSMVYASYTTATKAGGNNPQIGTTPDPYEPEEHRVFEIGTKNIFADGAILLNAAIFMNKADKMLFSNIENAGSINYNIDAEINGFEGNLITYFNETTRLEFNWLFVDSELGDINRPIFDPINPGNIVAFLGVDPTGYTPGVAGCAVPGGICAPGGTFGAVPVDGLPLPPSGALSYTYGLNAAGVPIIMMKSFGFLCAAPLTPANVGTMVSTFNPLAGPAGACPFAPETIDINGNTVPGTTESAYSLSLNKDFIGQNGVTTGRLTYRYQDAREGNVFNQETARIPEQKFFDFSLKYKPNDGKWHVGLYGKNLADDQYIGGWAASSPLQGGSRFGTYTDPRTYGVTFGREF